MMITTEDAVKKVLIHLQKTVLLVEKDEFLISLKNETQDEWIFHWDNKSWVETQDVSYLIPCSHLVGVKKATGECYTVAVEWKLW